jgi:hypothetical protein
VGFVPHSQIQKEMAFSTTRFNIGCCGRRFGKSLTYGHRMTAKSFKPDSYNWIVGPTYKLGEKEFRVVFDDYKKLGLLPHCKKRYDVPSGKMRIETPWGAIIEVVSAEKPDSLLGEGLDHVVMAEAAKHNRATWEQYIEPALSDKLGTADFPSTPQGYNWYYGLFQLGQENNGVYSSWRAPSWENTVRYPGGYNNPEIVRLRATTSKHFFNQEIAALFTSFAGAIYEEWDERIHIQSIPFNPSLPNYLAFDYGFANPFCALDVQISPSDHVHVWREYYSRFHSTFDHANTLKNRENPPGYHIDALWGDPRGADEAATLSPILGYVASDPTISWKLGVEAIKRLLKAEKLTVSPECPNLIRQMGQLHVKETKRQTVDLSEMTGDGNIQHKVDDHAADALRYLVAPFFVRGAGSHISDIYGQDYQGSEAEDFLTVHSNITMDDHLILGGNN